MKNEIIEFELSPQEALVIEASLKNDDFDSRRDFLYDIGRIAIGKDKAPLRLTEKDLWYIRDRISPSIQVGGVSGLDVTLKIYNSLYELQQKRLWRSLGMENITFIEPMDLIDITCEQVYLDWRLSNDKQNNDTSSYQAESVTNNNT